MDGRQRHRPWCDHHSPLSTGYLRQRSYWPRLLPPVRLREQDARNGWPMPPTRHWVRPDRCKFSRRVAQWGPHTVPQAWICTVQEHRNRGKRLHRPGHHEKFPTTPKRAQCAHLEPFSKSPTSLHFWINVKKRKCKEEHNLKNSM